MAQGAKGRSRQADPSGQSTNQTRSERVKGTGGICCPMMLSIPPKYAVSQAVGYIKGKSAIHLARVYGERHRGFIGQHFWA